MTDDWGNDPLIGSTLDMGTIVVTPDPPKVSRETLRKKLIDQGYSEAGAEGVIRNFYRESRLEPNAVGDGGTSIGLGQWHKERKDALEAFAKERGGSATDPDIQLAFFDNEMREKFPKLREQLISAENSDEAEDSFKRIYERPASVLWANNPQGQPVLSTDRFRFSGYAMGEHDGRKNTSVVYMDPQDYLDLSPDLEGDAAADRSGKSLAASLARGEEVESIPTLDVSLSGPTATVTDQDGRHRALFAQQAGVQAIPVAMRQSGSGQPTEIQGATGKILPFDFRKVTDLLVPRAEAAEPAKTDWGNDPIQTWGNDALQTEGQAAPEPTLAEKASALEAKEAAFNRGIDEGFLSGLRDPIEGGAQLLSHLAPAPVANAVNTANNWLARNTGLVAPVPEGGVDQMVRDREARLQAEGVDPFARFAGEIASPVNYALPGAAPTTTLGRLGAGALAGGWSALIQPTMSDNYWRDKATDTAAGLLAGAATGAVSEGVGKLAGGPSATSLARRLMNEGVQLTPGQMAGGVARRTEDALASVPVLGSAIRKAQRRSIETFNRAAINRSLGDLGVSLPKGLDSGHEAIAYAQQQFQRAYDGVIPRMVGQLDPGLQGDLGRIAKLGQNLPTAQQQQLMGVIQHDVLAKFSPGGGITGQTAQEIGTSLDNLVNTMRRDASPDVRRLGTAIREVDAAMDRMMARLNPVLQQVKDRIDAGYSKFKVVQQASRYAASLRESPDGTFTPSQLNQAVLARDRSKDKAAYALGDALLQDLAGPARQVLPSVVPDSGTPERGMLMMTLGGAAHIEPHTAAMAGAAMLPYTRPGMTTLNRLAQPQTGQFLRNFGAGLAPAAGIGAGSSIPTIVVTPSGAAQQ